MPPNGNAIHDRVTLRVCVYIVREDIARVLETAQSDLDYFLEELPPLTTAALQVARIVRLVAERV